LIDSHSGFRGKIFKFEEFGNLLQSMPVSSLLIVFLDVIVIIFGLIFKIRGWLRKKNIEKQEISIEEDEEEEEKKEPKLDRLYNWLLGFRLSIIEMNITDFSLNVVLNLSIFPKYSEITEYRKYSFILSVYILSRCVFTYLRLWYLAQTVCFIDNINPEKITKGEEEF